ncbi:MAG: ORF6N domain-containing protein [Salinivirgaceae bacterium]|nr:ORF6N domain-containing protein [Salinivirgaceae bacterium]
MEQHGLMILNETDLRSKIHTIRGLQVMLDFDLAAIYGYETKRFNEQIKNNIERFDEDFRFQLSEDEFRNLRSNFSTSSWGGLRYVPYAFTEQGIYMLMTVLKGDLAVRQSKTLIRIFKQMKDFIVQSQNVLASPELLKLSIQTAQNTDDIREIQQTMVTKDYLQTVIKDFTDPNIRRDYLFFNGETVEAAIAYSTIYSAAKQTIFVIDNYINLKTLALLKTVKPNVKVVIFSDNIGHYLHKTEFDDFCKEYPNVNIELRTTGGIYHDRYILIDHGTADEKIFHCGGSSKDAGARTTSISQVEDKSLYKNIISDLQQNPMLTL